MDPQTLPQIVQLEEQIEQRPTTLADYVATFASNLLARVKHGVNSAAEAEALTTEALQIRDLKRSCEAEKTAITTPLHRMMRAWGDRWNPAIKALQKAEDVTKKAVLVFQQRVEREAAKALAASTSPAQTAAVVREITTRPMGHRDVWRFHVVDKASIPARFWVLDQDALDEEARTHQGATQIPGGFPVCDKIPVMRKSQA